MIQRFLFSLFFTLFPYLSFAADEDSVVLAKSQEGIQMLVGLLDRITQTAEKAIVNGVIKLEDPLISLLLLLAVIGIASNFDMYFSETFNFGNIFVKIIHIGFFVFLIRNWLMIVSTVKDSFVMLGTYAGGNTDIRPPADIITSGLGKVFMFMSKVFSEASISMDAFLVWALAVGCLLVAIGAFFYIAYELFCVNIEFLVVSSLSVVLLPFAMTKWTSSFAEKPWNVLVTAGAKLMIAFFMISLLSAQIDSAFVIPEVDLDNADAIKTLLPTLFTNSLALLFISYLFKEIVQFTSAIVAGATIRSTNLVEEAGNRIMRRFL